ncbi:NUDIX domain-containing protein [Myroides odoratus]|uniref:NUDIX hydrolase n=1 Tax=Myroides odoratus TaxID=256 RepID=UPI00334082B0
MRNPLPLGIKRAATLCVLKQGNQFLLLKRLKEPHKDNFTPIGGKIDPFESPLQGAIRETFEETDLTVQKMKFCGILTESSPTKYNWINYVYLAEIEEIVPPLCNEGTLMWIQFDALLQVPTPKTDWFIYKYILDEIPFALNAIYDDTLTLLSLDEEIENVKLL